MAEFEQTLNAFIGAPIILFSLLNMLLFGVIIWLLLLSSIIMLF